MGPGFRRGDGPRRDGPRGDGPRGDGPRRDGPRGDGPRGDGPRGDGPRGAGPRGDGQVMRAVAVNRFGGPEVLELIDVPAPQLAPGDALVNLEYAGINFIDIYMRS